MINLRFWRKPSEPAKDAERKQFDEDFGALWRVKDKLWNEPEFFFTQLPTQYCSFCTAYVQVLMPPYFVGALFAAAEANPDAYIVECKRCHSDMVVLSFGGSPLSGSHCRSYICTSCGRIGVDHGNGKYKKFGDLWHPLADANDHFVRQAAVCGYTRANLPEWNHDRIITALSRPDFGVVKEPSLKLRDNWLNHDMKYNGRRIRVFPDEDNDSRWERLTR